MIQQEVCKLFLPEIATYFQSRKTDRLPGRTEMQILPDFTDLATR